MAGRQIRLLAGAGVVVALLASGAMTSGAPALSVGVTVPGVGGVEARLPAVTVPSVTVPSVTVPSVPPPLPVPSIQTPSVQTPSVQTPSVQAPSAPAPPSVGGPRQQAGSAGTGATAPGPSTAGGGTAAASSGRSDSAPTNDTAAGLHSSGPAGRLRTRRDRVLVVGSSGHPAGRTIAQRRLELAVERRRQCLDDLRSGERRVLDLRAGVGPRVPLTRPQVALRLDLGVAQTGRIERRGLRRLDALAGAGACGGAGAAAAITATGAPAGANGDTMPAAASDLRPHFGVGGVVAHGGDDPRASGRSGFDALPLPIGDGGEATLLVALGLLVALALLVRRELSRR